MFVLVAHFTIETDPTGEPGQADLAGRADRPGPADPLDSAGPAPAAAASALELLAAAPECLHLLFARSTEVAERWVLVAEFASAAAYRRALAPWPMRTSFIPWLSTADVDGSAVSEVLLTAADGALVSTPPTVPAPAR